MKDDDFFNLPLKILNAGLLYTSNVKEVSVLCFLHLSDNNIYMLSTDVILTVICYILHSNSMIIVSGLSSNVTVFVSKIVLQIMHKIT